MKLIHLSDTHVGRADNHLRLQKLLQDIASLGQPQDFVIIHTGDLCDQGIESEIRQSRALLDPMLAQGWRILLAPGNHDYGNAWRINPAQAQRFDAAFTDCLFGTQPRQFPILTVLADYALIGLDSNAAQMGWWDRWFAEGQLGATQINALNSLLDRQEVRSRKVILYLHHHPFLDAYVVNAGRSDQHVLSHYIRTHTRRFRRLKDAYSLMQCIRDRVDILLFGHQHFGLDYSAEGQRYGIPLVLDGSSSTAYQMDTDRMRYRVIDVDSGTVQTRMVAWQAH